MFKYLVLFFISFLSTTIKAQNSDNIKQSFSLGFVGEKIFHPGLTMSYQYSFKLSKNNFKHNLELGGNLFLYTHPKNHVGLRLAPSIGYKYITSKNWNFGLITDCGLFRRFYNGKVYVVDESGNVKTKYLAGQSSLSYGAYFSIDKIFHKDKKPIWGLFGNIGFFREINTFTRKNIIHPVLIMGFKRGFTNEK